jgi:hypothetical protein
MITWKRVTRIGFVPAHWDGFLGDLHILTIWYQVQSHGRLARRTVSFGLRRAAGQPLGSFASLAEAKAVADKLGVP